jgi:hypothetical protein
MKLDRQLQNDLLNKIAAFYPERDHRKTLLPDSMSDEEEKKVIANLIYLEQHGLIESGLKQMLSGDYGYFGAKMTARGMDFIADDGGLSAVLGVVTVKLHEETLVALIESRIEQSELPAEEKKKWTAQLRSLPADAIKHLVMKLVDKGLDHAPDVLQLIQRFLLG